MRTTLWLVRLVYLLYINFLLRILTANVVICYHVSGVGVFAWSFTFLSSSFLCDVPSFVEKHYDASNIVSKLYHFFHFVSA